jgi:hypothetical protein
VSSLKKLSGRGRQVVRVVRGQGPRGLLRRVVRAVSASVGADVPELEVLREDVADSSAIVAHPRRAVTDRPIDIAWITTPPSAGSGGHTTTLRFVKALEDAGHSCTLYLYDRFDGHLSHHRDVLRTWWPQVGAEIRDVRDGIGAHDAFVATSWQTAHVVATRVTHPGERFYLVQDFEPYFYPLGSDYELAQDTYRFGFHHISVGYMVADELKSQVGVDSVVAEFGCDTDVYSLVDPRPRKDVVFYTRPGTARRGYDLGVLALARFHEQHPESVIHTFGADSLDLDFPAEVHGRLSPAELNELYNRCAAGLALSFTNISLIANELLAAGAIPVVNDSPRTRADLDNPYVEWGAATPLGLADALGRAVDRQAGGTEVTSIAASIGDLSWVPAQQRVVEAFEQICLAPPT